ICPTPGEVLGQHIERVADDDDDSRQAALLDQRRRVSHDLDVVLEGVEARLAGLGVVADRDDQYVLRLDAIDTKPTDLRVREERKRVEGGGSLHFTLYGHE